MDIVIYNGCELLSIKDGMQKGRTWKIIADKCQKAVGLSAMIKFQGTCFDPKCKGAGLERWNITSLTYGKEQCIYLPCSSAFRGNQKRMTEWIKALMQ